MLFKHITLAVSAAAIGVVAHPGHDITAEVAERREYLKRTTNLQAQCGEQLAARGLHTKAKARREALTTSFREKRGLSGENHKKTKRQLDEILATDHQSNLTGITFDTDPDTLFADSSSCLLMPETIEGPYYVSGELVRDNMTETQGGVAIAMDVQLVDTNTCEPLANQYVEFWHCNSTGVYGGIVADGNGVGAADPSNIDATWLRGIAATDADGVVQMASVFPGHYVGRATHIHVLVHGTDAEALPNGTITGGTVQHVGQLYFDQSLISEVETLPPYTTNEQLLTLNVDDFLLALEQDIEADPVFEYAYAGEEVGDGLVMWATVGIDTATDRLVVDAARLTEEGGVANASAVTFTGEPLVANNGSGEAAGNGTESIASSSGAWGRAAPGLVGVLQALVGFVFVL